MSAPGNLQLNYLVTLCDKHLRGIVSVKSYEYTSCYLWHDRSLFDEFGDKVKDLQGNTVYLYENAPAPAHDLLHELGHMVARENNLIGHTENGYQGSWENKNRKLIAQVCQQKHWSSYLNLFSLQQENFSTKAASELWAELFMLWHLHRDYPEAALLEAEMRSLETNPTCIAISALATALDP